MNNVEQYNLRKVGLSMRDPSRLRLNHKNPSEQDLKSYVVQTRINSSNFFGSDTFQYYVLFDNLIMKNC